ncbi:hypothetical protein Scep_007087 [Stephania cephalantha]|uniref:PHD-type zinc finger plants domain-containing protein n=1 Tax=Stephania cephalantha TaxID=152367 RepID=A0AAP0PNI1_9MAGN
MEFQPVCCMCGDIGFPHKLFRCTKCCNRFQHSYCSNYYDQSFATAARVCDWCMSEERSMKVSSKKFSRSDYSGGKQVNNIDHEIVTDHNRKGKNSNSSAPSPKPTSRRYKFLKDVMC